MSITSPISTRTGASFSGQCQVHRLGISSRRTNLSLTLPCKRGTSAATPRLPTRTYGINPQMYEFCWCLAESIALVLPRRDLTFGTAAAAHLRQRPLQSTRPLRLARQEVSSQASLGALAPMIPPGRTGRPGWAYCSRHRLRCGRRLARQMPGLFSDKCVRKELREIIPTTIRSILRARIFLIAWPTRASGGAQPVQA